MRIFSVEVGSLRPRWRRGKLFQALAIVVAYANLQSTAFAQEVAASPETDVAPTTPPPEPPASVRETDVAPLDLCALAPKEGTGAFQRQRLVLLDLAEDPSMTGAPEVEVVKQGDSSVEAPRNFLGMVRPFEHAREVFLSVFPMKRFYLVFSGTTPGAVFADKKPITVAQAQASLASDPHVAHSLGCADWLAAPYLTRGKAVWTQVQRERTVIGSDGKSRSVSYQAWRVSVGMSARLEVYRRDGDSFIHHASLQAEPRGTAADDSLNWGSQTDVYATVSVSMPDGCMVSAFQSCGGKLPRISPHDVTPTLGGYVRGSHYCQGLDDAVRSDETNRPALALCELRVASEYVAVDMQLQAKRMCGWRLFSPLLDIPGNVERGVSMGQHEGAERGSYYVAYSSNGEAGCGDDSSEAGYGRIYRVGPGGDAGFKDPSEVHFQAGNPPTGVRMEELAMHGLRFGLRPAFALVLAKGDLESTVAGGALFEFGYDLTKFIPVLAETWVKAEAGWLVGAETFMPIGVSFEGASYVADRLSVVGDVGLALTVVSKSVPTQFTGARDLSVSGAAVGAQIAGGINYSIRPEWNARVMLEVRSGFGATTLKNDKQLPGYEVDGGALMMSMISISTSYNY